MRTIHVHVCGFCAVKRLWCYDLRALYKYVCYYYYYYFKVHQHKAAGRKTRLDIQNYGCNGNLLCYHGVVERNRISCYNFYYCTRGSIDPWVKNKKLKQVRVGSPWVRIFTSYFKLLFWPRYSITGELKIRYAIQQVQKSTWYGPYSSSSFTKLTCIKMALYRWIKTESPLLLLLLLLLLFLTSVGVPEVGDKN